MTKTAHMLLAVVAAAAIATTRAEGTTPPPRQDLETLNQSSRGFVGTGDNVLIGGAIIKDSTARIVIRALGPTLAAYGLNYLHNPMVTVFDGTGKFLVQQKSYLENSPADLAVIASRGLTPSSPNEVALVLFVKKGNYTAVVQGENGTTGIGLVEFYLANP